ncbi:unnamed protein product, partial [Aphanomyces euteiches]
LLGCQCWPGDVRCVRAHFCQALEARCRRRLPLHRCVQPAGGHRECSMRLDAHSIRRRQRWRLAAPLPRGFPFRHGHGHRVCRRRRRSSRPRNCRRAPCCVVL